MGKALSIVAACAIVAGGVVFGLYSYTDMRHHCEQADLSACSVVEASCCGDSTVCETAPAMAIAGPAAALGLSPVNAEAASCCSADGKTSSAVRVLASHACCEASASEGGLVAVTGTAATAAHK